MASSTSCGHDRSPDGPRLFMIMSWISDVETLLHRISQHLPYTFRGISCSVHDPAPDGVVDVVVDIGDLIGKADDLSLQRWTGCPAVRWFRMPSLDLPGQVQSPCPSSPAPPPPGRSAHNGRSRSGQISFNTRTLPHVQRAYGPGHGPGQWPPSELSFIRKGPGDGPGDLGDLQRVGQPASGSGLPPGARNTWVLCFKRRNDLLCRIRSRSLW